MDSSSYQSLRPPPPFPPPLPPPRLHPSLIPRASFPILIAESSMGLAIIATIVVCLRFSRYYDRENATEMRRLQLQSQSPDDSGKISGVVFPFQISEKLANIIRSTECSVCLENFKEGEECKILNGCKHTYHRDCINQWLMTDKHCPLCRGSVRGRSVHGTSVRGASPLPSPVHGGGSVRGGSVHGASALPSPVHGGGSAHGATALPSPVYGVSPLPSPLHGGSVHGGAVEGNHVINVPPI